MHWWTFTTVPVTVVSTAVVQLNANGLLGGTKYWFRIRAVNTYGNSPPSEAHFARTMTKTYCPGIYPAKPAYNTSEA